MQTTRRNDPGPVNLVIWVSATRTTFYSIPIGQLDIAAYYQVNGVIDDGYLLDVDLHRLIQDIGVMLGEVAPNRAASTSSSGVLKEYLFGDSSLTYQQIALVNRPFAYEGLLITGQVF